MPRNMDFTNAEVEAFRVVGFVPSPLWRNVLVDIKGEAYPSKTQGSYRFAVQKQIGGSESGHHISFRLLLVCGESHHRWEWVDTVEESLQAIGEAKAILSLAYKGRFKLSALEGDYAERYLARILDR